MGPEGPRSGPALATTPPHNQAVVPPSHRHPTSRRPGMHRRATQEDPPPPEPTPTCAHRHRLRRPRASPPRGGKEGGGRVWLGWGSRSPARRPRGATKACRNVFPQHVIYCEHKKALENFYPQTKKRSTLIFENIAQVSINTLPLSTKHTIVTSVVPT
jgi:hypothetical protein